MKMNLNVLLEAAKYLEQQDELKAKQRQIENNNGQTQSAHHLLQHQQQQQQQHHHHQQQRQPSPPQQQPQQQESPPPPLQQRPVSPSHSLLKQELTATLPPPLTTSATAITSTTTTLPPSSATSTTSSRIINNSFDIINPIVTDEGGEQKRKQPPLAFRSGTREVHNKLEKHRRAHLKECFDLLKRQLPIYAHEKKASNLSILHSALCFIQALKRKERELEHEMERLAREKIAHQQKLAVLKKEAQAQGDNVDFSMLLDIPTTNTIQSSSLSIHHQQSQSPTQQQQQSLQHLHHHHHQQQQQQQQHHHHHHQHHQPIALENNLNCKLTNDHHLQKSTIGTTTQTIQQQSINDLQKLRPSATTTTNNAQRTVVPVTMNGIKEGNQMQTTALSVLPVGYPVSPGLVLQKVALVPKSLTDLSPLVSSPAVAHFIAAPQQIGGKVVPLVNAQYVVKPVVVVSTPSRPS